MRLTCLFVVPGGEWCPPWWRAHCWLSQTWTWAWCWTAPQPRTKTRCPSSCNTHHKRCWKQGQKKRVQPGRVCRSISTWWPQYEHYRWTLWRSPDRTAPLFTGNQEREICMCSLTEQKRGYESHKTLRVLVNIQANQIFGSKWCTCDRIRFVLLDVRHDVPVLITQCQ